MSYMPLPGPGCQELGPEGPGFSQSQNTVAWIPWRLISLFGLFDAIHKTEQFSVHIAGAQ